MVGTVGMWQIFTSAFSCLARTYTRTPWGGRQDRDMLPLLASCMKLKKVVGKLNPKLIVQPKFSSPLAPHSLPPQRLNSSHRVQERVIENSRVLCFFFFLNFSTSGKSLIQHLVVNH